MWWLWQAVSTHSARLRVHRRRHSLHVHGFGVVVIVWRPALSLADLAVVCPAQHGPVLENAAGQRRRAAHNVGEARIAIVQHLILWLRDLHATGFAARLVAWHFEIQTSGCRGGRTYGFPVRRREDGGIKG